MPTSDVDQRKLDTGLVGQPTGQSWHRLTGVDPHVERQMRATDDATAIHRRPLAQLGGVEQDHLVAAVSCQLLQHRALVVGPRDHHCARLPHPEPGLLPELDPALACDPRQAQRLARLRGDSTVAEVANRRTDRPLVRVRHDNRLAPPRRLRRHAPVPTMPAPTTTTSTSSQSNQGNA